MKAKSRRRLLISSVAMLLVAMLALGTATFAWFTTSTSATANGINVGTVKSSNLKISRVGHSWEDSINYNHASSLYKPTSSVDGINWKTAVAAVKDDYAKNDAAYGVAGTIPAQSTSDLAGLDNYVFVDELNIKNAGDVNATNVTITVSVAQDSTFSQYGRIALVPSDVNYKMTGTFKDSVYANETTAYTPGYDTVKITPSSIDTPITVATTLAPGDENAKYYRLFVWFEGEDTDCKDVNAGQVLSGLTFTVSGTTGQG